MLKMPQQQYIKFLREAEGCSIREISQQMGIHWRTAKRYADQDNWNQPLKKKAARHPVMGPYIDIVNTWLEEDQLLPRKQRLTGVRIFHRLREEHQFPGGQRTVLAYVRKRKQEMQLERAKTYERLEHPPGEAQVDFTTIQVSRNQQLLTYKLLVVSFPYSNAAYVYPTPAENQECFLEAMQQCFQQMGGVPRRIWFDNLSAAVVHLERKGERQLTEGFQRFCAHYRFEAVFCNPYSGHEKGNVERKCGYSKRNWAVPIPAFESHEQLASFFAQQAEQDLQRLHYAKGKTIIELWKADRAVLLTLPEQAYEAYRLSAAVVNKYGEVLIEGTPMPLAGLIAPGRDMLLQWFWDRVVLMTADQEVIRTVPRPYTEQTVEVPWEQVFQNWLRKPRSVRYSHFLKMLPPNIGDYLQVEELAVRKERLKAMHHWSKVYTLELIEQVLQEHPSTATIIQLTSALGLKQGSRNIPVTWSETLSPPGTLMMESLQRYDQLIAGGASCRTN